MIFFKYFLASILFSTTLVAPSENGWFSVEKRVESGESLHNEVDLSVWVLYIRDLGTDRIQIRFPEDPHSGMNESEGLELNSETGTEHFQLLIQASPFKKPSKNWDFEKNYKSENYFYSLRAQTKNGERADQFFSSFSLYS